MVQAQAQIGALLSRLCAGDDNAFNAMVPLLYDDLRQEARRRLRVEAGSIDPAELVHEAYLRLVHQRHKCWDNRAHFLAVAATAMRRVLVDDARRRKRRKRGDGALQVPLISVIDRLSAPAVEPGQFDRALEEIAIGQPRLSRVLELRALGGLTVHETARVLKVSPSTVKRDWSAAVDYLRRHAGRSTRARGIFGAKE